MGGGKGGMGVVLGLTRKVSRWGGSQRKKPVPAKDTGFVGINLLSTVPTSAGMSEPSSAWL